MDKHSGKTSVLGAFYALAVITAATMLLGISGIAFATVVILFWAACFANAKSDQGFWLWKPVFAVTIVSGVFWMISSTSLVFDSSSKSKQIVARGIRQINLAILNYESANGHLPPAYVADEAGKPMHSWRVLLLPYMEQQKLYDQYRFDEPWDGPDNRKLADQLKVSLFSQADPSKATYKLVTGTDTVFSTTETASKVRTSELFLNSSQPPITVVEDQLHPVCWMQPDDLSIDDAIELFDAERNPDALVRFDEEKYIKTKVHGSFVGQLDGTTLGVGTLSNPSMLRDYFTVGSNPTKPLRDLPFRFRKSTSEHKAHEARLLCANILLVFLPTIGLAFRKRRHD
jgi:hypothetical protein